MAIKNKKPLSRRQEIQLEEAKAAFIKKTIAQQLEQTMKKKNFSKTEFAEKLRTSRSALDRLLDPTNTSVTLSTLVKAAHALGKKLRLAIM